MILSIIGFSLFVIAAIFALTTKKERDNSIATAGALEQELKHETENAIKFRNLYEEQFKRTEKFRKDSMKLFTENSSVKLKLAKVLVIAEGDDNAVDEEISNMISESTASFIEHCKEETGYVIPDSVYESFLGA